MTVYHWIVLALALISMFAGTLLTSLLSAFILWVKTKGLIDVKLSEHGRRIGALESREERFIDIEDCKSCKLTWVSKFDTNEQVHKQMLEWLKNLTEKQQLTSENLASLTTAVKGLVNGIGRSKDG
jgi:hypothetical protein